MCIPAGKLWHGDFDLTLDETRLLDVAAAGFKDTTRVAASNPRVWREIFQDNREALAEALGAFRHALDDLDRLVAAGDATAIERELERIKRARERLS